MNARINTMDGMYLEGTGSSIFGICESKPCLNTDEIVNQLPFHTITKQGQQDAEDGAGWVKVKTGTPDVGWKSVVRQKELEIHRLEVQLVELADSLQATYEGMADAEERWKANSVEVVAKLHKQIEIKELKASKLQELLGAKDVKLLNIFQKLNATSENLALSQQQVLANTEEIAQLVQHNALLDQKQKENHRLFQNASRRAQELHSIIIDQDTEGQMMGRASTAPLVKEIEELRAQSNVHERSSLRAEVQIEELWRHLESSDALVVQSEQRVKDFEQLVNKLELAVSAAKESSKVEDLVASTAQVETREIVTQASCSTADLNIFDGQCIERFAPELQRAKEELVTVAREHTELCEGLNTALDSSDAACCEVLRRENEQLRMELRSIRRFMDDSNQDRSKITRSASVSACNRRRSDNTIRDYWTDIEEQLREKLWDQKEEEWRKKLASKEAELATRNIRLQAWKTEALAAEKRVRSLSDMIRILKLRDMAHEIPKGSFGVRPLPAASSQVPEARPSSVPIASTREHVEEERAKPLSSVRKMKLGQKPLRSNLRKPSPDDRMLSGSSSPNS